MIKLNSTKKQLKCLQINLNDRQVIGDSINQMEVKKGNKVISNNYRKRKSKMKKM